MIHVSDGKVLVYSGNGGGGAASVFANNPFYLKLYFFKNDKLKLVCIRMHVLSMKRDDKYA